MVVMHCCVLTACLQQPVIVVAWEVYVHCSVHNKVLSYNTVLFTVVHDIDMEHTINAGYILFSV